MANEKLKKDLDDAIAWFTGGEKNKIIGPVDSIAGGMRTKITSAMRCDRIAPAPEGNEVAFAIQDIERGSMVPWLRIKEEVKSQLGIILQANSLTSLGIEGKSGRAIWEIVQTVAASLSQLTPPESPTTNPAS